jgi:hypothetical protein
MYTDPTVHRRYLIIIITLTSQKQETYQKGKNKNTRLENLLIKI